MLRAPAAGQISSNTVSTSITIKYLHLKYPHPLPLLETVQGLLCGVCEALKVLCHLQILCADVVQSRLPAGRHAAPSTPTPERRRQRCQLWDPSVSPPSHSGSAILPRQATVSQIRAPRLAPLLASLPSHLSSAQ